MNCLICNAPAIPRSPHCPRPLVATEAESAARPRGPTPRPSRCGGPGRGGSRTGRGGGIGDEAVRRCHVGEGVVSGSSSTAWLPFSPTTLARPARTRAPSLPGHVVLPESDGPMPSSRLRGAGGGRVLGGGRRVRASSRVGRMGPAGGGAVGRALEGVSMGLVKAKYKCGTIDGAGAE